MTLSPSHQAGVRLVRGDILLALAREIERTRPRRLTLFTPWLSGADVRSTPLRRIIDHARANGTRVLLITRPATSAGHLAAITAVGGLPRSRVILNSRLHAKLFVCEDDRNGGFAMVGSANLTRGATNLDEFAVLVKTGDTYLSRALVPRALKSLTTNDVYRLPLGQPRKGAER